MCSALFVCDLITILESRSSECLLFIANSFIIKLVSVTTSEICIPGRQGISGWATISRPSWWQWKGGLLGRTSAP